MDPIIGGALIGAGAQVLGTGIQSWFGNDAAEKELKARKQAAADLKAQGQITDNEYRNIINNIDTYYQNRGSLGTEQDVNAYKKAIANYNDELAGLEKGMTWGTDQNAFDSQYDKTKEDFVNPYYAQIIGDTANQIQHTAAGAGLGRGTGAALNIAQGVANKSDELYRTAMNEYNNDRNFAYKQYTDAINNNYKRLEALKSNRADTLSLQGDLAKDYYNTQDQAMADRLRAEQDRMGARAAYSTAIAGLY